MSTSPDIAVGIGNPLRSDDGLGHRVVEVLKARLGLECEAVHQLTPELVERLRGRRKVVFVDASVDQSPGQVGQRAVVAAPAYLRGSHILGPSELLGLAEWLDIDVPEGRLFTVGVSSLEHGDRLSREVEAAVAETCDLIESWLAASSRSALERL